MAGEAAGFWSYVQLDDQGDHGRIRALARDLREEYRIQTGEPLELFFDRDSIAWGDAWEQRIDNAIAGTTFFIPVITPSYFRSNACRQELLKFVREAERLGLTQLLMSVYWVSVPALDGSPEESGDEAVRYVAKYHWQDLREERFEERGSSAYRKAVSDLAEEIASRAALVETVEDVPEEKSALVKAQLNDEDDEPGIMERIAVGEDAMHRIADILERIRQGIEDVGTKVEASSQQIQVASSRGQGMKAALSLTNRLAHELDEPTTAIEEGGKDYAKALADLDPAVHAWLDIIEAEEEPDEAQVEFLAQVEGMVEASDEALTSLGGLLEASETMSALSRALRAPVRKMRDGLQGVLDGQAITTEWGRRARGIRSRLENPPSHD